MTSEKNPREMAQGMSLERLADVLNKATLLLANADMSDPVWQAYAVLSHETYVRLAPHYGEVSDEELAAVLMLGLAKPPQSKTGLEDVVLHLVEDEMRSRFPVASAAADDALAGMELGIEPVGEYDYLRVLLRESGVSP